ncbi:MAG TPA: hypothetical protein VIW73_10375 [Candidatus Cybelea sp.]
MVKLSSATELFAAVARAKAIDLHAYTLHGPVLRALEDAASRGARVGVELEGSPHDDPCGRLARENRRIAAELRAAGVDARLGDGVHAKSIVADGTLFLDDRNWNASDIVLRDDDPADAASIPTLKHEALAAEAGLLRSARRDDGVIVASGSFGCCNSVYSALDALAQRGAAPRLVVGERELRGNAREREILGALVRDGVRVRAGRDTDKLALDGGRAWIGSANATVAFDRADLPDWGLCSSDPAIVAAVRDRVESEWTRAKPLVF